MGESYLDNAATTRVLPEAAEAAADAMLRRWGNPSSNHAPGLEAADLLASCRKRVSETIGCGRDEVYFTSGGTEANNIAVLGMARAAGKFPNKSGKIVTTEIEHPSVRDAAAQLEREGFDVARVRPDRAGNIGPDEFLAAVDEHTVLCAMMLVNNEVGSILPVAEAARGVKLISSKTGRKILFHCDAVQALGKLPFSADTLGVDSLSLSAHKIHGAKGTGALYIRKGTRVRPLIFGGGQQLGFHPGTENMPGVASFAAALAALPPIAEAGEHFASINHYARQKLSEIGGVEIISDERAHPGILSFATGCVMSETMLNFLSGRGIYVSGGSACSKGKRSHVLTACKLPNHIIDSAIRLGFSRFTTKDDIDALCEGLRDAAATLAKFK